MSIRWLVWSLLSPSQLILFAIVLGIVLFAVGRMRSARFFLLAGGTGLVVFGLLPTSIYLANILETRFPQPALPERVDGIVLLAGAEKPASSEAYGESQVGAKRRAVPNCAAPRGTLPAGSDRVFRRPAQGAG